MSHEPIDLPSRLVKTKLSRPTIAPNWVQRHHLLTRLNEGLERRATLLCAPAGYGKTTVAVQWLERLTRHSVWLSLDQRDRELDVFVRYLLASLTTAWTGFESSLVALLQGPVLPPPTYLADAIVEKLLDRQTPIIVALDDFHLAASPPVTEFVARCCENLPEAVHWVLLTRERPALPLSLWQARNWLNEFTASDLAFSIEETQEFFARVWRAHLATQEIERVQRQTEGWPAGLRMVELSRASVQSQVSTSDVSLVDESNAMCFLAEQVLEAQPVELRRFFGLTASLDRFCAPLCDELLTATSSSQSSNEIIRELERKNLFLDELKTLSDSVRSGRTLQSAKLSNYSSSDLQWASRRGDLEYDAERSEEFPN